MDAQKVDMFLMSKSKFFEENNIPYIRERLLTATDSKWVAIQTIQFKDPTIILIVSIIAGAFGVDRFLIGDTGLGLGKLLTCGGLGIWTIIDWFLIMGTTKEKNMTMLERHLY